jgi:hypothetical protein
MFRESSQKPESKNLPLAPSDVPRKLTPRDIALGIGRKATDAELEEYLSRPYGKSIPLKKAVEQIKRKLEKKHARAIVA